MVVSQLMFRYWFVHQLSKRKELLYNLGAISSYSSMLMIFVIGLKFLYVDRSLTNNVWKFIEACRGLSSSGLIKWMWMARQADLVQSIPDGFPLHEMTTINLVTVKAIPNIGTAQCCFRPIVSLALHFLSVLVLPVNPINILIWRNIVVEDYHRELHRFVSTLNTTIGNAASSHVELTRWCRGLDFLAWEK